MSSPFLILLIVLFLPNATNALELKKYHANFNKLKNDAFVNCIDPKELEDCRFINDVRQFRIEADEEKEDEMEAALEELNTRLVAAENQLVEAGRALGDASTTIDALNTQVQQLSGRIATAETEINQLKNDQRARGGLQSVVDTRLLDKPKEFGGSQER